MLMCFVLLLCQAEAQVAVRHTEGWCMVPWYLHTLQGETLTYGHWSGVDLRWLTRNRNKKGRFRV
jgi:hypothetical protein